MQREIMTNEKVGQVKRLIISMGKGSQGDCLDPFEDESLADKGRCKGTKPKTDSNLWD